MKSFLNGFTGGLGRALGRIFAFILLGLIALYFINNNKENVKSTIQNDIREVILHD